MYSIGIDLGGSSIKFVCIDESGTVLDKRAPDIIDHPDSWAVGIKKLILDCIEQRGTKPSHIGIAAPGLADANNRYIAFMPGRLAGLENLNWTEFVGSGIDICVMNDAQAALVGEHWLGAAAGLKDAFMLTLGTGVGGAVLMDGKVRTGTINRLGHLGHISLHTGGALDCTNIPGSLEDAIADKTLLQRSDGIYSSTKELVDAVASGSSQAEQIWHTSIRHLAVGIASLINVLDPAAVILGGGMISAGSLLFRPLEEMLTRFEWRPGGHSVAIRPAELGDFAGAIGAARFAALSAP